VADEYTVVEAKDKDELKEKVDILLLDKWKLEGGVHVTHNYWFYQALKKKI